MLRRAAQQAVQQLCSISRHAISSSAASTSGRSCLLSTSGSADWLRTGSCSSQQRLACCWRAASGPTHSLERLLPWCPDAAARSFATEVQRKQAANPGLKYWKPTSPGQRGRVTVRRTGIWKGGPMRHLTHGTKNHAGRNHRGRITVRHQGGGRRSRIRLVDFKRQLQAPGVVERLEYDPGRSAYIALVKYQQQQQAQQEQQQQLLAAVGSSSPAAVAAVPQPQLQLQPMYSYILAPQDLNPGDTVTAGPSAPVRPGSCLPLRDIPVGMAIHNIEMTPGRGGQLCRSGGSAAAIVNKQETHAIVRLPSGEQRLFNLACSATIGAVSNPQHKNRVIGKAGINRHRGIRPTVRGVAMNPIDHPHGGGTAGGRPSVSPWGIPTKGHRTRSKKNPSNKWILLRASASKRGSGRK